MNTLLSRIVGPFKFAWRIIRTHLKTSIAVFVVLFIAWMSYAVTRPAQPVYVTAVSERGDLKQTVEAVGTVISEKDLELQFSATDVVAEVLVKEGAQVKAGQKLASLRSGTLSAGVASASANVQSAQAALDALLQGSRPEDIVIAEAGVANKRASLQAAQQSLKSSEENLVTALSQLDTVKREAGINLSGQVSTAGSTVSQQVAVTKTALQAIKGVFGANDVSDAVVKSIPTGYDTMMLNINTALNDLTSLQSKPTPSDYQAALTQLSQARVSIAFAADISNRAYDIISNLALTSYFTNTSKETNKGTIATQKSYVQTALSSIDSTTKSLQDASASYDSKIASQQSQVTTLQGSRDKAKADIATYQTLLTIEEAQLALKKAPARQTDIDAARARVRQAQADVSRASAQLRDTVLVAPMDGIITKVNVKVGQIRPISEPAITMLGNSPYRIEMFVSEVDIPKVVLGQSGSITLDAFRSTPFPIHVGEIDSAATDKDGVPKYRIKLDFNEPIPTLKVGMTGDADIITGSRSNVVTVPLRSVVETSSGTSIVRVIKADGTSYEEVPVTTGMEGEGGAIEVTGLDEGKTVIVLIKQ